MNAAVKSAVRTLRLLELFASSERPLALRDVAAALAIPKSSTHMLLGTMISEGYIEESEAGGYVLAGTLCGPQGWVGGVTGAVLRAAGPELDRLLALFRESVVFGVPTLSGDVRIATSRQSPLAVRYDVSRDPIIPGWCTAMGHAMLSHLPEAEIRAYLDRTPRAPLTGRTITDAEAILVRLRHWRACGHALNVDERIDGASGAAVAILDPAGHPRAAINVVTLTPRFLARQAAILEALKTAARAIEAAVFDTNRAAPDAAAMGG